MNPDANIISGLCNVRYPIIQAPMLGITTPDMVAAASDTGVLGSLPLGGLSPEKAVNLIREVKSKTSKPFAVNLFAHPVGEPNTDAAARMQQYLDKAYGALNPGKTDLATAKYYNHTDLIDLLLDEQIKIISFTFGVLEDEIVAKFKANNVILMGTATSVNEALILEKSGVDAIVAQGFEAGGHRGSFLKGKLPQIGLFSLLPQIVDSVKVPVIAAGGIVDSRTVRAALALGADAVQIGSMFLASDESEASDAYKEAVLNSGDTSTELTNSFTGRYARGISNAYMEDFAKEGLEPLPYPYQNTLTGPLRSYAKANNRADITSLWAGQSASAAKRKSTVAILEELIASLHRENVDGFTN